jgi:hypothetical protein
MIAIDGQLFSRVTAFFFVFFFLFLCRVHPIFVHTCTVLYCSFLFFLFSFFFSLFSFLFSLFSFLFSLFSFFFFLFSFFFFLFSFFFFLFSFLFSLFSLHKVFCLHRISHWSPVLVMSSLSNIISVCWPCDVPHPIFRSMTLYGVIRTDCSQPTMAGTPSCSASSHRIP